MVNRRARVISVSLTPELLATIEEVQQRPAFKGRSEVIRAGLTELLRGLDTGPAPEAVVSATLTLSYASSLAPHVGRLRHDYDDVIQTILHSHQADGSCLEVFVLQGQAGRIREVRETLLGREGLHRAELVWVPAASEVPPATGAATAAD